MGVSVHCRVKQREVRSQELTFAGFIAVVFPRFQDDLLQHLQLNVGQFINVKTCLAGFVLPQCFKKFGQFLILRTGHQVD